MTSDHGFAARLTSEPGPGGVFRDKYQYAAPVRQSQSFTVSFLQLSKLLFSHMIGDSDQDSITTNSAAIVHPNASRPSVATTPPNPSAAMTRNAADRIAQVRQMDLIGQAIRDLVDFMVSRRVR